MSLTPIQDGPVFRRKGWSRLFRPVTAGEALQAFERFGNDLMVGRYTAAELQPEIEGLREQRRKAQASSEMSPALARLLTMCEPLDPLALVGGIAGLGLKMVGQSLISLNYREEDGERYAPRGRLAELSSEPGAETPVARVELFQRPQAGEEDPALVYLHYVSPPRHGMDVLGVAGGVEVSGLHGFYFVPRRKDVDIPQGEVVDRFDRVESQLRTTVASLEQHSPLRLSHCTTGFGEEDSEHWFRAHLGGKDFSGEEVDEVTAAALYHGLKGTLEPGSLASAAAGKPDFLHRLAAERNQPLLRLQSDRLPDRPGYTDAVPQIRMALELEMIEEERCSRL